MSNKHALGTPVSLTSRTARAEQFIPSRLQVPADFEPIPLREFVIKAYELCNLACDYCYMYELADQSYKGKPTRMATDVFEKLSERIAEHVRKYELTDIAIVFHGGEPLLRGMDFFNFAVAQLRSDLPENISVDYRLQTNGILLNDEKLHALIDLGIKVGVSLDGSKQQNDRHRRYRNGKSSYDEVVRGIALLTLPEFRPYFSRLYCTVDIDNDPIATYENLAQFSPPVIDFLLPHGNWDTKPPQLGSRTLDTEPGLLGSGPTPYADWLIAIFDHWYDAATPQPAIRYFTEIINMILGGKSHVESIGLSPSALVVIETNGAIEQVDALRSAFEGATDTGLNIFDNDLDDVLHHPSVVFRQIGVDALCDTCKSCRLHQICGAGYMPHRYSSVKAFSNPSIYCEDLMRLIDHISSRIHASLAAMQPSG